ncbi:hemolysin XhlA family protein [Yoonia sp. F2084L]|uniref:hemolysin XhlA family protein n=1 Tax=Yoonia sp. F2084L TaxID=2926419 RepID=UPI001FF4A157|nr:hemolysin XhlA family protein [Yoonia sp. F2084L]MCK0094726.1 hemolysin XhlA family protein [Yoonia sp. F2084L]
MQTEATGQLERRVIALEMRNAVDDVHRANVAVRLSAIEDTLKWLVRLVIGGLLMAGVTYAMQGGFAI